MIRQLDFSALYDAFDVGQDLNTEGFLQALEETVPLSQTMQEEITSMREWAKTRARFTGRVDEEELAGLYARCLAVYYAPVDEDFGMVPYEAFLAEKPVVTTTDAGGPLEVVSDRTTGLVIEPQAAALAEACSWLREHVDDARAWGKAGKAIARRVSWDETIARLLA